MGPPEQGRYPHTPTELPPTGVSGPHPSRRMSDQPNLVDDRVALRPPPARSYPVVHHRLHGGHLSDHSYFCEGVHHNSLLAKILHQNRNLPSGGVDQCSSHDESCIFREKGQSLQQTTRWKCAAASSPDGQCNTASEYGGIDEWPTVKTRPDSAESFR